MTRLRRTLTAVFGQLPLTMTAVVAVSVMVALLVAAMRNGVSIEAAVADPHELTRLRLLGIVSNVGVLLWAATLAVCLLAAATSDPHREDGRWRPFFLASAAVTAVLLIDDFLLVHEFSDEVVGVVVDFDRTREQKDILETAVFGGYALILAGYAATFRQELTGAGERRFLVGAMAMFATSLFVDLGGHEAIGVRPPGAWPADDIERLAEEGPKFIGICWYTGFFALMARRVLRGQRTAAGPIAPTPGAAHVGPRARAGPDRPDGRS